MAEDRVQWVLKLKVRIQQSIVTTRKTSINQPNAHTANDFDLHPTGEIVLALLSSF
jgi:hypothetical protein